MGLRRQQGMRGGPKQARKGRRVPEERRQQAGLPIHQSPTGRRGAGGRAEVDPCVTLAAPVLVWEYLIRPVGCTAHRETHPWGRHSPARPIRSWTVQINSDSYRTLSEVGRRVPDRSAGGSDRLRQSRERMRTPRSDRGRTRTFVRRTCSPFTTVMTPIRRSMYPPIIRVRVRYCIPPPGWWSCLYSCG